MTCSHGLPQLLRLDHAEWRFWGDVGDQVQPRPCSKSNREGKTIQGWVETPFSWWIYQWWWYKHVVNGCGGYLGEIGQHLWPMHMMTTAGRTSPFYFDVITLVLEWYWRKDGFSTVKWTIQRLHLLVTSIPFDWRGWLERVYAIYGSISRFNTTQFSTWPNWYLYSWSPSTGDLETSNNVEQLRTISRHGTRLRSTRMIKTGLSCQSTCGSGWEQRQYLF